MVHAFPERIGPMRNSAVFSCSQSESSPWRAVVIRGGYRLTMQCETSNQFCSALLCCIEPSTKHLKRVQTTYLAMLKLSNSLL
jgi:hypothetical protein